jgi:DNA-binding transcriptional LysR family regulator
MIDCSSGDLAVLRTVALRGSFTAAAAELGYTQSAISRRVAALEAAAGEQLFVRGRGGVRVTDAGEVLLRHASTVVDALEAAERELTHAAATRARPVRLGAFGSAMAGVVPVALGRLAGEAEVTLREGTSAVLVRALRAGTLDLALLASVAPFRPPDDRAPALVAETLAEGDLRVAVGARHRLAGRSRVRAGELRGERWVVARSEGPEHLLGVWPGLDGAPDAPYIVRDWLSKLRIVASGAAITTVPDVLMSALPPDVRAVAVTGGAQERRRLELVWAPHVDRPEVERVAAALRDAARQR